MDCVDTFLIITSYLPFKTLTQLCAINSTYNVIINQKEKYFRFIKFCLAESHKKFVKHSVLYLPPANEIKYLYCKSIRDETLRLVFPNLNQCFYLHRISSLQTPVYIPMITNVLKLLPPLSSPYENSIQELMTYFAWKWDDLTVHQKQIKNETVRFTVEKVSKILHLIQTIRLTRGHSNALQRIANELNDWIVTCPFQFCIIETRYFGSPTILSKTLYGKYLDEILRCMHLVPNLLGIVCNMDECFFIQDSIYEEFFNQLSNRYAQQQIEKAIKVVHTVPELYCNLPICLKQQSQIICTVLTKNAKLIKYVPVTVWQNQTLVKTLVFDYSIAVPLQYLKPSLQQDENLVQQICRIEPKQIHFAPVELQRNAKFLRELCALDASLKQYFSPSISIALSVTSRMEMQEADLPTLLG